MLVTQIASDKLALDSSEEQHQRVSASTGDFETFLKMLTAQIQNQNPFEPIEASDFAVQLATFSSVEQNVRTNVLLDRLLNHIGFFEMGSLVGHEVLSSAPVFIGDAPVRLKLPNNHHGDRSELVLRNSLGSELGRFEVDSASTDLVFEMPSAFDGGLPADYYLLSVESFRFGSLLGIDPVLGYNKIEEIRSDDGRVFLMLQGGYILEKNSVIGLR